jgi:hypothetical protein
MPLRKRDSLWFGLSCTGLAGIIALCGYFLAPRSFIKTWGVITHTASVPGGKTPDFQAVTYTYSVAGMDYTGHGTGRLYGVPESWRTVGDSVPVYYDRASPAASRPFGPPRPWGWIGGSVLFAAMGIIAIIAGWPH